ncbi:hypothetical protein P7C70_g2806, partial [Phenoliferia sp. Uapishka_3]
MSGHPTQSSAFGSNNPFSGASASGGPVGLDTTPMPTEPFTNASAKIESIKLDSGEVYTLDPSASTTAASSSTPAATGVGHNDAEQHVDNLASGLGGMIINAPMAALEAVSPTVAQHLSNAAGVAQVHAQNLAQNLPTKETLQGHAQNLATHLPSTDQIQGSAQNLSQTVQSNLPSQDKLQEHAGNAGGYVAQAKDTILSYIPSSLGGTSGVEPTNPLTGAGNPLTSETSVSRDATDKVGSSVYNSGADVYPDAQKTYTESATDYVKEKADAAASYIQPQGEKTLGQKALDKMPDSSSFGISDTGRQSTTDKIGSSIKPDSQKTYTESATDFVKGKADAAASYVQPDSDKSLGQKASDTFGSSTNSSSFGTSSTGDKSYTDSATDFVKGKAAAAASAVPSSEKNYGQRVSDTYRSSADQYQSPANDTSYGITETGGQYAGNKQGSVISDTDKSYSSHPSDVFLGKATTLAEPNSNAFKPSGQSLTDKFYEN